MSTFKINSRSDIPHAIQFMTQAGAAHEVPLYSALYHGRISLLPIIRSTPAREIKLWRAKAKKPAVAVIGDDAQLAEDGPSFWPLAPLLIRWARFIAVHGAVGRAEEYQYIVELAQLHRRVLLIECSSSRISDWQLAVDMHRRGALAQVFAPASGLQHPSPMKKEAVN